MSRSEYTANRELAQTKPVVKIDDKSLVMNERKAIRPDQQAPTKGDPNDSQTWGIC